MDKPWKGKLHHSRRLCDDWGNIRDEAGELIIRVPLQTYNLLVLNEHRKNKTDPTQATVDAIISAINETPAAPVARLVEACQKYRDMNERLKLSVWNEKYPAPREIEERINGVIEALAAVEEAMKP